MISRNNTEAFYDRVPRPAERRALRWFHHVQGLRPAPAEGPEEDRGRTAEDQRGAERRQAEGRTREVGAHVRPAQVFLLSWWCLSAAKAHRRSGRHPPHAAVRRVVRRVDARIHRKHSYSFGNKTVSHRWVIWNIFFCFPAGVLPSVPHQEGLRGNRAEHLPSQPRVRSHVLNVGALQKNKEND